MSNSGVNTGFAKCFILFMAIVILLQGVVYLGLSIWGIILRDCSQEPTNISEKPFDFAIDLVYLIDKECGEPVITITAVQDTNTTLNVDWDQSEVITNRTFIFFICYTVISALWIITSLLVITTICGPVTRMISGLCFWPWFLVIIAGSIIDVVATGFHVHDIFNTTSVDKTFAYLGITASDQVMTFLRSFDAYFITPAVVMTCISSRVILIWLLNIFGSSFCLSLSNVLLKRNSTVSSTTSVATASTAPVNSTEQQQPASANEDFQQQAKDSTLRELQLQQQLQQQQQLPQQQQQEQQQPAMFIRPKPLQIQDATSIHRQSSIPGQQNRPFDLQSPAQQNRQFDLQSPVAPQPSSVYPTAPSPNTSEQAFNDVTYRNTESHPDKLNYPNPAQTPTSPYHKELSPSSLLNNRYSTMGDSLSVPSGNQRVSEELRSQLPWSYTSMPPPVPKKPQKQAYPDIPNPDYGN